MDGILLSPLSWGVSWGAPVSDDSSRSVENWNEVIVNLRFKTLSLHVMIIFMLGCSLGIIGLLCWSRTHWYPFYQHLKDTQAQHEPSLQSRPFPRPETPNLMELMFSSSSCAPCRPSLLSRLASFLFFLLLVSIPQICSIEFDISMVSTASMESLLWQSPSVPCACQSMSAKGLGVLSRGTVVRWKSADSTPNVLNHRTCWPLNVTTLVAGILPSRTQHSHAFKWGQPWNDGPGGRDGLDK